MPVIGNLQIGCVAHYTVVHLLPFQQSFVHQSSEHSRPITCCTSILHGKLMRRIMGSSSVHNAWQAVCQRCEQGAWLEVLVSDR